ERHGQRQPRLPEPTEVPRRERSCGERTTESPEKDEAPRPPRPPHPLGVVLDAERGLQEIVELGGLRHGEHQGGAVIPPRVRPVNHAAPLARPWAHTPYGFVGATPGSNWIVTRGA